MTEQLLGEYPENIQAITIMPSDGGRFEVSLDGELVFSKLAKKHHPDIKEIRESIKSRLAQ